MFCHIFLVSFCCIWIKYFISNIRMVLTVYQLFSNHQENNYLSIYFLYWTLLTIISYFSIKLGTLRQRRQKQHSVISPVWFTKTNLVSTLPFSVWTDPSKFALSHFKSRLSISHPRSPIHDTTLMHGFSSNITHILSHNRSSTMVFFSNNRSFFCQSIDHRWGVDAQKWRFS